MRNEATAINPKMKFHVPADRVTRGDLLAFPFLIDGFAQPKQQQSTTVNR
jgi:hypothetical protein